MMRCLRCALTLGLVLLAASCASTGSSRFATPEGVSSTIRVLLAEGNEALDVVAPGGVIVRASTGMQLLASNARSTVTVTLRGRSVNVRLSPDNSAAAADDEVVILAKGDGGLTFGGYRYAGEMKAVVGDDGKLKLVNVLPLERYVEGVLPYEMGNPGPEGYDALKSQAVAARTYAVSKMIERRDGPFDVYASVLDQVYRGIDGQTSTASSAVRDTKGRVLNFNGELARTYYSACCGGHTSDIRQVWPQREPADYLTGVLDRERQETRAFCTDNKYFRWRYSFSGRELGEVLRVALPRELGVSEEDIGALVDVRVGERTRSGRVVSLTIETTERTFTVNADRIRWVLMPDVAGGRILPSVMFKIDKVMERDRIAFISIAGGGNGHGVGMCQNGAIAMARKGYTYQMILEHYYPGCVVSRVR